MPPVPRSFLASTSAAEALLPRLLRDASIRSAWNGRRSVSAHQVAGLLGFADQSNFFRACRRWFGEPPGRYRRHVVNPPDRALL